jgi:NAD(P)-dependent dehydrogenase (short-subunit alcohol dehydrogenase family)
MEEMPTLTKVWRNASYPAIDPTKASLSVAGKTVFITGASAGIGLATAHAFAAAGASTVAISGRTEKTLETARKEIEATHTGVKVLTFVADVTNQKAVESAFSAVGKVDILVSNAAHLPDVVPIAQADLNDWWPGFETNIKGAFIVVQAFLRVAAPNAIIVNVSTAVVHLPSLPGYSGYVASKLGGYKFFDSLQVENPTIHVVHVHPGLVQTAMGQKGMDAGFEFTVTDG